VRNTVAVQIEKGKDMATVAELRAKADDLGLKYTSKTRKPELEQMVAEALFPAPGVQVPEVTRELTRRERAALAGAKGKSAEPMSNGARHANYVDQGWSTMRREFTTPRQERRMRKNANRAKAAANAA